MVYSIGMPAQPDEKGLLSDTNRFAAEIDLIYILIEMIQNRKWNEDTSDGKFVFATFDIQGKRYLVIGYNHFRSDVSIEKEHTPFNWRANKGGGEATIGTRGYGAKLLPFKIGGQYSNYYHLHNSSTFPTDLSEWGMKESINITKLQEKLESEQNIDSYIHQYRENYIVPCNSKDGVSPTLLIDSTFTSSELYSFFKENNFKYFYVFSSYNTAVDACLDSTLQRIANLYESNTAQIYRSKGLAQPTLITTDVKISLGLCESRWAGEFTLEWMLGEKDDLYWKSICRYHNKHTGDEIFSKLSSNGSKDRKFGMRNHYFNKENLETEWNPDIRVTVAITSDDYVAGTTLLGTDAALRININVQGDIIDDSANDFGLGYKIRHMEDVSRVRIIMAVLRDTVKKNNDFGLHLGHLKKDSGFSKNGAIYQMVLQTLARANDYFKIIKETYSIGNSAGFRDSAIVKKFSECMQVDKKNTVRSMKRKKEAIKFEGKIAEALTHRFEGIEWDHKDSHISAQHNLNGEGIDSLGNTEINGTNVWIALQVKDKESGLTKDELNKFVNTVEELRVKYPNDIFLSYLVLCKKKGFTAELSMNMMKENITVLWDSTGETTPNIIENQLAMMTKVL